ncbi:MAG: MoaD/ThiS family protein [Chloroflexi bacterium]|nr:MoaD/ThiS family protein [Chloroflexota bacterium]
MKISVKAFALLQSAKGGLGTSQVSLEMAPGATLHDLVEVMAQRYGQDLKRLILTNDGQFCGELLVTHNEERVKSPEVPLTEGDVVFFIAPIEGG